MHTESFAGHFDRHSKASQLGLDTAQTLHMDEHDDSGIGMSLLDDISKFDDHGLQTGGLPQSA